MAHCIMIERTHTVIRVHGIVQGQTPLSVFCLKVLILAIYNWYVLVILQAWLKLIHS